jgi:hypothetical protein
MYNFVLGIGCGLYVSGCGIGVYNSLDYSKKIIRESYSQSYPNKLISYYGAITCSVSMAVTTGFAFVASPIILPVYYTKLIDNKQTKEMDDYDIISFVK